MILEKYINENIKHDKDNIYYNESFCLLTLDYMSSWELSLNDIKFLNLNKYSMYEFLEEEFDADLINYLESEIKNNNLNLF